MKVFFAANVWGKHYIDIFCDLTLPMHFAFSNIPMINKEARRIKYLIVTTLEDLEYFKKKAIINKLQEKYDIQFYPVEINLSKNKYNLISSLQCLSMNLANIEEFDFFFPFYADVLCSNGTLYNAFKIMKEGKKCVVSLGPQTVLENMTKLITFQKFRGKDKSINISSRELVKLTFQNLHPFHAPSFWEKKKFTTTPSMIFFKVSNGNVLAHGFHLHPVSFKLPDDGNLYKNFYGTLDENYLPLLIKDIEEVHISQDSDEVFMCSLESLTYGDARSAVTSGNPSVVAVSRYAERHTSLLHREFIKFPIRLHSSSKFSPNWPKVENNANDIIHQILSRLNCPDSILEVEDLISFQNRKYHINELKKMNKYYMSFNVGLFKIFLYLIKHLVLFYPKLFLIILIKIIYHLQITKIFTTRKSIDGFKKFNFLSTNSGAIVSFLNKQRENSNKFTLWCMKINDWSPFLYHKSKSNGLKKSTKEVVKYLFKCFKFKIYP